MRVALFFGSFNPIHYGHITIAKMVVCRGYADCVWMVVSPQNPLKGARSYDDKEVRADMAEKELEIAGVTDIVKVCRVEFAMAIPSYTVDTLKKLINDNNDIEFVLIIGEDNLRAFHKWKDYKTIADMVEILVYPRKGNNYTGDTEVNDKVKSLNIKYIEGVDLLDISSSELRLAAQLKQEGLAFHRKGELDKALNKFYDAQRITPEDEELNALIDMVKSIFEYAYMGHYNP